MDVNYRIKVIKNNTKLIMDVEEGIRYQYELHEKIDNYLNNKFQKYDPSKISSFDKRIAVSHSLYLQNFKAIHAAYTLILTDKLAASRILVRRIHESILVQYYVALCNDEDFTEYEELSQKDHTQKTKLGYNFYKHKLYDGDIFKNMSEVYAKLSDFTHATWKTSDIKYNNTIIEDSLLNLCHNSLFNVISYCQVYTFDQSLLKNILDSVQSFVDEQLFNSNHTLKSMFPNKLDIVTKILWHP